MKRVTQTALGSALTMALVKPAIAKSIESQSNITDLGEIVRALYHVLIIFLPAVATIYLAISGYRYIVAQGNPELIEKAKKSLTYAIYGVILSYASVLIITLVADALNFHP